MGSHDVVKRLGASLSMGAFDGDAMERAVSQKQVREAIVYIQVLEAERNRLRKLVKQAHEYMCETGEAPIHLAKQFQALGGGDE